MTDNTESTLLRKSHTGEPTTNVGQFGTHDHTGPEAPLTPAPYNAADDYYDRLSAVLDPNQTAEGLQLALDVEAEDDFMSAIANHPNATPEQIDRAAHHNSYWVRRGAAGNPHTSRDTLIRLRDEAHDEGEYHHTTLEREGRNPMSDYHEWGISQCAALESYAVEQLRAREG